MGIVSDEDGGEVPDMFVLDPWLGTVITHGIIPK